MKAVRLGLLCVPTLLSLANAARAVDQTDCAASADNTRCEYRPVFLHAKMLEQLDYAGLNAYAESSRQLANARIYSAHHRTALIRADRKLSPPPAPAPIPDPEPASKPARPDESATPTPPKPESLR